MPNYLAVAISIVLCSSAAFAQVAKPPSSAIGFNSVAEALAELKSRPGVSITTTKPDAWIIISDSNGMSIWSFTPEVHYAYPAVVHRELKISSDGNLSVEMHSLCEAQKEPCDKLMKEFEAMNAQMREQVQNRLKVRTEKQ